MDGIAASSLPFGQFDSMLENVKRGWRLNRAAGGAAAAASSAVSAASPAVTEWGAGGGAAQPRAGGYVTLGPSSHLTISPEGLIEVKERCCLVKRRSVTWGDRVKWVRAPMASSCAQCSSAQMGTSAEAVIEAPMDALHTNALLAALRPSILGRAPARAQGPASAFTACAPQCNCQCPKKTISIDNDFTTITTQATCCSCSGSTTMFRTEDVPWVYSERSATLWCQGIASLVIIAGTFAMVGFFSSLGGSGPVIAISLAAVPPGLALLSCLGVISFSAIASLCCKFTVVTLGTPGSAAWDDGSAAITTNVPLMLFCCLCCPPLALLLFLRRLLCGKAAGSTKVYNCEAQSASDTRRFVAAAKASISAANAAARHRAAGHAASGGDKAGASVVVTVG